MYGPHVQLIVQPTLLVHLWALWSCMLRPDLSVEGSKFSKPALLGLGGCEDCTEGANFSKSLKEDIEMNIHTW